MFIEKLFGNTFGMIWLVVFMVAILGLIVWMFVKKDKEVSEVNEDKVENSNEEVFTEKKEEVLEQNEVKEEIAEEKKEKAAMGQVKSEYEIIESEDGFFRVRKVGSERTLRKLATRSEAEEYIKSRG